MYRYYRSYQMGYMNKGHLSEWRRARQRSLYERPASQRSNAEAAVNGTRQRRGTSLREVRFRCRSLTLILSLTLQ